MIKNRILALFIVLFLIPISSQGNTLKAVASSSGGGGAPTGAAGGDLSGTYPNPTIGANKVTLAKLATQAANTGLVNATAGAAVPTAVSLPSCSTSGSALNYTTSTGFSCNTAIVAASATGNSATATALAANGTNCSAGSYPLGVDASGNSESCTAVAGSALGTPSSINLINATHLPLPLGPGFSSTTPVTGQQGTYWRSPCSGAITGWDFAVDAGTATVQTWKVATGTASPTVSNSISTSGVSISTGTALHSTTTSDFTITTVTQGDIFAFNLSAVATATKLSFQLEITCN